MLAERLARGSDRRVLLCDVRSHVGGNAYDHHDDEGILVHRYGPHIFHTSSREVFDYLSWLLEAWRAAHTARKQGVRIQAITAWSLLGAFDWDCLVVAPRGRYEAGAFDVRASPPRPTALADLLRSLGGGDPGRAAHASSPG